jgi:hypothetical protein
LPKGTPEDVRLLLTAKLRKILASAEFAEFMRQNGFAITVREGPEFERFLAAQEERWRQVIAAAGFASPGAATDPGPWFFPALLSVCLVAGTLALVANSLVRKAEREAASAAARRARQWLTFWTDRGKLDVVLLVASLPVYLAAIPRLGFFPSTLVWAVLVMKRLGLAWLAAIPLTAALLAAIYMLFVYLFRVQLPMSPWGPPI